MEGVGGDSTCGFPSMMMTVNNSSSGTGSSNSNRRVFLVPNLPFTTTTTTTNNNNNNSSSGGGGGGSATHASMVKEIYSQNPNLCFMESSNNTVDHVSGGSVHGQPIKAKIMAHPHFPRLLAAYANCQKVGAPPEVVARLEEACAASRAAMSNSRSSSSSIGEDPALDQFMEAYCEMLSKYEQELTKPFKEAMLFLSRIEYQFKALTLASSSSDHHSGYGDFPGRNGSSEDDIEAKEASIDPQAEEKNLKGQLLRRYSGYLGNLKQEFLKKKKKGKLPKEARQQLLDWWTRHYKWPYPSETQKLALAESTGLDQKQINNWFINQRKRHWKPSEDMQFVVMDAAYPHYYMENVVGNPFPMDFAPAHL